MYYRSVNRGLSFTKPGLYAFGLVLMIGMIAVTTGMNGLYVFLSAGLGGFIVSGLLSEKAMKSCRVTSIAASMVDAGQPFTVTFTVENQSPWFTVFALQTYFLLEPPRFRLISHAPSGFAAVKLSRVPPGSQRTFVAPCRRMPRGLYDKVLALQQTTFPFGILEKFKLGEIPASLIVAPAVDASFLEEVRRLVKQKLAALDADREFFSHRAYQPRDAMKHVDWKKSAARPSSEWVVKQYRSPAAAAAIRIDAAWSHARGIAVEAEYEGWLARVRTAIKAIDEVGRGFVLDLGDGRVVQGRDACLAALAAAPRHAERARGPGGGEAVGPERVVVGASLVVRGGAEWVDAPRGRARA